MCATRRHFHPEQVLQRCGLRWTSADMYRSVRAKEARCTLASREGGELIWSAVQYSFCSRICSELLASAPSSLEISAASSREKGGSRNGCALAPHTCLWNGQSCGFGRLGQRATGTCFLLEIRSARFTHKLQMLWTANIELNV